MFWRYSLRYSGLYWAHFRSSANSLLQYWVSHCGFAGLYCGALRHGLRHFRLAWLQQPQRVTFCTWLYPAYPSVTRQPVKPLRKASARLPLRSGWYSKSRTWCRRSAALAYSHILDSEAAGFPVLFQHLHHGLVRMDDRLFQKPLLHVLVQRLQPGLAALNHPVGHGSPAQGNAFSFQIFSCLARGSPSTYFCAIMYATVEAEARECFISGTGGLYGYDTCKPGILFALVAGIGDRFLRQMIQHLSLGAFLFPLMSCNKNSIRFGFLRFVVLCGFRFVKQTELVFPKNVSFLLAGLTEPGS